MARRCAHANAGQPALQTFWHHSSMLHMSQNDLNFAPRGGQTTAESGVVFCALLWRTSCDPLFYESTHAGMHRSHAQHKETDAGIDVDAHSTP